MNCITKLLMIVGFSFAALTPVQAGDDHKGHQHGDEKGAAHAHEAKAEKGGVVAVVKDVSYELVAKADTIALYISDHGKPVDVTGASGTVTLMSGSDKTEAKLAPAGDNKLEAKGVFKIAPGAKALASITLAGKPAQNVRFTLK